MTISRLPPPQGIALVEPLYEPSWQPCPLPQTRTWPEERDATAPAACASELAVQSMGHGHPAELVQRGMAYTEGTQVVLVHVDELLEEEAQSVSAWPA